MFWFLMSTVWFLAGAVVVAAFGGIGAVLFFVATLAVLTILFDE